MRLGGIAPHLQNGLGIANIVVAVGHRAIAPGVGDPGDRGGMADTRLMIGIVGSPERRQLTVEVGSFVGELGRTEPVNRVRPRLLANFQQLVADLVDGLVPRNALPLAVHKLHRIAQAALAQHVVADRRALAAMRSAIDRAVIVRLLADPHTIGDFGDHRTADRTMGADVFAGGNLRPGRRWRTGFGFAYAAERKVAKRCQRPGSDTGALQESTAIPTAGRRARFCADGLPATSTTLRLFDQHGRLLSGRISVDAVEVLNLRGRGLVARPAFILEVDGFGGRRLQHRGGARSGGTGNRNAKQVAPADNRLGAFPHNCRTPRSNCAHVTRTAILRSSSYYACKVLLMYRNFKHSLNLRVHNFEPESCIPAKASADGRRVIWLNITKPGATTGRQLRNCSERTAWAQATTIFALFQ